MIVEIVDTHAPDKSAFGKLGKVHNNLERIGAIIGNTPETYVPTSAIALATGIRGPWIHRLLNKRPGFVRVVHVKSPKHIVEGYYLDQRFADKAAEQMWEGYPSDTTELVGEYPSDVLLIDTNASNAEPTQTIPWKGPDAVKVSGTVSLETIDVEPHLSTIIPSVGKYLEQTRVALVQAINDVEAGKEPDLEVVYNRVALVLSLSTWLQDKENRGVHAVMIYEATKEG